MINQQNKQDTRASKQCTGTTTVFVIVQVIPTVELRHNNSDRKNLQKCQVGIRTSSLETRHQPDNRSSSQTTNHLLDFSSIMTQAFSLF